MPNKVVTVLPNGNVKEVLYTSWSNPITYINGVIQKPEEPLTLKWHRYFAIIPRRINGHYVWLRYAYRAWDCRLIHNGYNGRNGSYRYGTIFDVLMD